MDATKIKVQLQSLAQDIINQKYEIEDQISALQSDLNTLATTASMVQETLENLRELEMNPLVTGDS